MEISSKRAVMQYMQLKGHSPKETRVDMFRTLKYQAPSYATVKRWCNEFNKFGKTTVEDEPRSGRPRTVNCEETVLTVKNLIMQDRRVTTRDIADELGISNERVWYILRHELKMRKISARWVPRLLTNEQKQARQDMSRENCDRYDEDPENPDLAPLWLPPVPKDEIKSQGIALWHGQWRYRGYEGLFSGPTSTVLPAWRWAAAAPVGQVCGEEGWRRWKISNTESGNSLC